MKHLGFLSLLMIWVVSRTCLVGCKKPVSINVGVVFTFDSVIGRAAKPAMETTNSDINESPTILNGNDFNLIMKDANCNAFLGSIEVLVPLVLYAATDSSLSAKQFPFFVRTVQSDSNKMNVMASLVDFYGWKEVIAIYVDDDYGRNGIAALNDELDKRMVKSFYRLPLPLHLKQSDIVALLKESKLLGPRVYIIHVNPDPQLRIFAAAEMLQMMTSYYVWFATDWLSTTIDSFASMNRTALRVLQGVVVPIPNSGMTHAAGNIICYCQSDKTLLEIVPVQAHPLPSSDQWFFCFISSEDFPIWKNLRLFLAISRINKLKLKQKDKVGEAFAKHQERYKEDKILKWRNALTQVANIKGWHLNNRHESEFIGDIVKRLSAKLCQTYPVVIDDLIGIDSRSEEFWEKKDFVIKVLDGCGFFPDIGIDVLVKKSLIKVDKHNQHLWMHDLLKDMGRKIVKEKSVDEPGQRCRLWEESDVHHVLTKNTVTEVVEAIIIDNTRESERLLDLSDALLKMKNLRLLKVLCPSNCGNLNYLSDELRLLDWIGCPLRSLPSSFQPDNLVALLLTYSRIQQLWKGSKPLYKLNVVNLKGSENLIHTPDFTATPNLEFLILDGCTRLVDVHPSVVVLRRLKLLNLKDCKSLRSLPTKIGMESLETIILSGCSNLQKLPEIDGKMEYLLELDCGGTCIKELPPSFGHLKRLKILNLTNCRSLRGLQTIIEMEYLEKITLSGCSSLKRFPEIDGKMECLLELYLERTGIEGLPSSIGKLSNLILLNLKDCKNLVNLPSSIGGCTSLRSLNLSGCKRVENLPEKLQQLEFLEELDLSETGITEPPSFIFQFKNLKALSFGGFKAPSSKLRKNLPSLFKVIPRGRTNPMALMLPSLLGLSSLTKLRLRDCNLCEGDIPNDISCLSSLETLDLSGNNFLSIPSSLTQLSKLQYIGLSNCRELKSLPELLTNIRSVRIDDCVSLELVANPRKVCNSMGWAYIRAINCYRLAENVNALTLLRNHLKVFTNSRKIFDILIPGNEIPKWFSHQRVESSIKIRLPLNIRNDSQWMGVAFCCIFVNDDDSREQDIGNRAVIHHGNAGGSGSDGSSRFIDESGFVLGKEYNQPIKEDHLFLRYWSCDKLYPSSSEDKCGESETENSLISKCSNQECDELELSTLVFGVPGNYAKVKKCGVRIVYEKDLEYICSL
ncbi:hypothetical protein V6N11_030711 [Hibiscus sabdariffa]|uniref:Uncharacterized protein n=1 Tax=Hibiscus sabdariffa TaxID=183260 RepID=A0ABR2NBH3_9ROSI